ncbi:MAG: PAS domain-containing protein [Piscinibacter sp.]|uniref:hybrid sensor histidine kinase/response regulator n=1 Tax=Piscinibacter sp. TaxID=1903157 RepID=UPI002586702C|nr:PAS domain-containing protein [Piscinibacter sp.]MCW5662730.1 PAS domain-containing protein [Piscinibacter sp.]
MHRAAPPDPALLQAWFEQTGELLLLTDAGGSRLWSNEAFDTRFAPLPQTLAELAGDDAARAALQAALAGAAPATACVALRDGRFDLRGAAVGEHRLWTLVERTREDTLQAHSRHLAELLDMAQEFGRLGVWEREIPSGRGRWDHHVFAFWGLDPAGGTPDYEQAMASVHPEDRKLLPFRADQLRAGRYEQRYRVIRPDGGLRWLHSQWEIQNGPDGVPARAIGIMMDDTEAMELSRTLGDASAQLKLAIELADIAVWRHDLRTDRMHYNDRAYAVLGIEPRADGLPLDDVRALIHPDDLPGVLASAQQTLATDRPTDMQARYRRSDGSWRHVLTRRVLQRDALGEPVAFLGVALDVTERVRAEQALRSADERAALAARSAGIGTWEIEFGTPDIERWDEQMFRLRGLAPRAEPPPREQRLAMLHPEDRQKSLDSSPALLAGPRPARYEFRVVWPDGSVRWLASRSIPVLDAQGQVWRRIGVNWDITDSKDAEAARQASAVAERASQAKSAFLARMSHELRTPLNAVLGFTQLLQVEAQDARDAARDLKLRHIRSAGEHLLALVDGVLDLSSLEAGNLHLDLQPVDLAALVEQALPLVEPLAQRHGVRVRREALKGVVQADRTRALQVLVNLLSNAIKYNRPGGEVSVGADVADATVTVRVTDTGRGLTPQQIAHLFEPFNRLGVEREGIEGTGIGLTIARALVERMHGRIEARSTPGRGSTFTVSLPRLNEQPASSPTPLAALPERLAQRSGRLLYIEDNQVNVLLVEELVRSLSGLDIESTPTGADGVARAVAARPDLVLVDMQLPDFDGFEVLRRLRAHPATAAIPCVALSANAMPEDIERARAAGFTDYWTKPIDFRAFLAALEALFPMRAYGEGI